MNRRKRPDWWHDKQADRMWEKGQDTYCQLLELLSQRPRTTMELAARMRLTRRAVQYHLEQMRQSRTVVLHSTEYNPGPVRVWTLA